MSEVSFPRTTVGGVSLPRMIIGTNWFRGFSHTSVAKDAFIKAYQTPQTVADVLAVFLRAGIDAVLGGEMTPLMEEAITRAEQSCGRRVIKLITPNFKCGPDDGLGDAERLIARCREQQAAVCMPHQCVTDALADRRAKVIRDLDGITRLIRQYGMVPGLSTHMPETVVYADNQQADVETYIQIYNAAGFLMQVEVDWVMSVIRNARKPVLTIKPLAAGRLPPVVGLTFAWSTIRPQDMVAVGTTTPDEAREVIDISLDVLAHRQPDVRLQHTRSKASLERDVAR